MPEPRIGWYPPMVVHPHKKPSSYARQAKVVSQVLLKLMGQSLTRKRSPDARHLEVNCAFALIRWLHKTHIDHAKRLLRSGALSSATRGNLFLAILRHQDPKKLGKCSELFKGMELQWVYLHRDLVPSDFVFQNVKFVRCRLRGFPDSSFTPGARRRFGARTFRLQVEAFADLNRALARQGALRRRGWAADWTSIKRDGRVLYAVRSGQYDTFEQAKLGLRKLKATEPGAIIVAAELPRFGP